MVAHLAQRSGVTHDVETSPYAAAPPERFVPAGAPYHWSGDGANDLASNPLNWVQPLVGGQATPGEYDIPVFNGNNGVNSTKDAVWDLSDNLEAIHIGANYMGTVRMNQSISVDTLTVNPAAGATLDIPSGNTLFVSTGTVSGATIQGGGTLLLGGAWGATLTTEANTVIQDTNVHVIPGSTHSVAGNLTLTGTAKITTVGNWESAGRWSGARAPSPSRRLGRRSRTAGFS